MCKTVTKVTKSGLLQGAFEMSNFNLDKWLARKVVSIPKISEDDAVSHYASKNFQHRHIGNGLSAPIFDGYKDTINRDWNISISFPYVNNIPTHVHKYLEIEYVYQGGCQQHIQGRGFHMQKGDIILIDVNEPHSYKLDNMETIIVNILITNDFFNSEFLNTFEGSDLFSYYVSSIISQQNKHNQFVFFETHESAQIINLMKNILEEFVQNLNDSDQIIDNYLHILFFKIKREFLTIKTFNNIDQRSNLSIVYPFMDWLKSNYQTANLNSFSKSIGYHPDYVGKLIKKSTGKNFTDWVKIVRIKTAANFLLSHNQSITDIAHEVGYSNMTAFYKSFKSAYQLTPLQYRKKLQTIKK